MRHLFRVENIDRWGSNWLLGAKMCFFDPKIWIFGAKSQFFVGIAVFVYRAYYQYTWGYIIPIRTTPKIFLFPSYWFLAISGHSHFASITTLFWTIVNQTWWDRPDHQKNDPQWQRTWSRPELRRNSRFYVWPKSVFWPKIRFIPKKCPKFLKRLIIIWEKRYFFGCTTLPCRG